MTCDNKTIYERVIQLALRESLHYNRLHAVFRTTDQVLVIRSIIIPEDGDTLLGQTTKRTEGDKTWWVYEGCVSTDQVEATQPAEPVPQLLEADGAAQIQIVYHLIEDQRPLGFRGKGTWKRLAQRATSGHGAYDSFTATITCPQCGKFGVLEGVTIKDDGTVPEILTCPHAGCKFSGLIQLDGWAEEA